MPNHFGFLGQQQACNGVVTLPKRSCYLSFEFCSYSFCDNSKFIFFKILKIYFTYSNPSMVKNVLPSFMVSEIYAFDVMWPFGNFHGDHAHTDIKSFAKLDFELSCKQVVYQACCKQKPVNPRCIWDTIVEHKAICIQNLWALFFKACNKKNTIMFKIQLNKNYCTYFNSLHCYKWLYTNPWLYFTSSQFSNRFSFFALSETNL